MSVVERHATVWRESCFNGAALDERGNVRDADSWDRIGAGFNGAALDERGNRRGASETSAPKRGFNGAALDERGNMPDSSSTDESIEMALQWGRAQMSAEIIDTAYTAKHGGRMLQWGRAR